VTLDYTTNNPTANADARHIMWCFRALHRITGQNILAPSSYKLTDSDFDSNRSGLVMRNDGKWAFFTEWMSRGTVYFAPLDAQAEIIKQWKYWVKQNSTAYVYPKTVNFDDWYFGGPDSAGNRNPGDAVAPR